MGKKDPETLKIVENLASVLYAKKDKKGAVMYLTEVAEGYEQAYGAWHATTKRARQRLEEWAK